MSDVIELKSKISYIDMIFDIFGIYRSPLLSRLCCIIICLFEVHCASQHSFLSKTTMASVSWLWNRRLSSGLRSFLKFGLPMVLLVVIGSVGLSEFTEIKVKKRDEKVRKLNYEETLRFNTKTKEKPITLEEAYKEVQSINIDDWQNKRVPRPWPEDK